MFPLELTDKIIEGDVLEKIKLIPDNSVRCCITSPPYYGLRDYLTAIWLGGDPNCKHSKAKNVVSDATRSSTLIGGTNNQIVSHESHKKYKGVCGKCGAIVIDYQIGLEKTPEEYIEKLVKVFREIKRILTHDGTLWLNIGDSYWGGKGSSSQAWSTEMVGKRESINGQQHQIAGKGETRPTDGKHAVIKPKDLIGIPWMLAFALRADGWWLRQDIVWQKPNPMPECLHPNTQVFIRKNNWVSRSTLADISKMKELPEILSPTGWKKIIKLWKTQKEAIYFEAGKVERIICSPDHQFPISADRRRKSITNQTAIDIRHEGSTNYLLYAPINKFLEPIIINWSGVELNNDLGFLIGAFVAEGGRSERGYEIKLTIHYNEDEFCNRIKTICQSLGIVFLNKKHSKKNYQDIFLRSQWFSKLIDAFVTGKVKTKALNMELLLNTPQTFRSGILDGYIEGDGSDRVANGWCATTASRRLRDDISTLASNRKNFLWPSIPLEKMN